MMNSRPFVAQTEVVGDSPGSPANNGKTVVDMAKCHFGDTFQSPFFWMFLGIVGTIAVQCYLKGRKS